MTEEYIETKEEKEARELCQAFLSQESFGTYNRKFAKVWNINTAILLAELSDIDSSSEEEGKQTEDGFFCGTTEDILERTQLTRAMQENALKILVSAKIVQMVLRGSPPKKHFKIDYDNLHLAVFGKKGEDEYGHS